MQVLVRDNNIDQALRALKKKLQREGVFREMKRRRFYEKPSERSAQVRRCGERASSLAKRHSARDFFQPHATRSYRPRGRARAHHFRAVTDYRDRVLAMGAEMTPQFQIGQTVRLVRGFPNRAGGDYRIVRQLPDNGGEPQYCIKSDPPLL